MTTPRSKSVNYFVPDPEFPLSKPITEDVASLPKLFQPLKIRGLTLPNRIGVSPMCMYSTDENFEVTPFHLVHYGSLATRGAGLIVVESAAVSKEGALSPSDVGIWTDSQAEKLKEVVDFVHAQRQLIGVQLGHGGRKSSGRPMWEHLEDIVPKSEGGWADEVVAPSAIQFRPYGNYLVPNELTNPQIKEIVKKFGVAAKRAIEISGFDFVEIHGAHGYLVNEFLSATSNKRTDEYGGSFENRIRFALEVADEIRSQIPESTPVFIRISAAEDTLGPDGWTIEDSVKFVNIIIERGVDVIDISSGGNSYNLPPRQFGNTGKKPAYMHAELARAVKASVGDRALVACVGGLGKDPSVTNELLEEGAFDIALIGRPFLKNPGLTWEFADALGVETHTSLQYGWGFRPKFEGVVEMIARTERLLAEESSKLVT